MLATEELQARPAAALRRAADFLGLPPAESPPQPERRYCVTSPALAMASAAAVAARAAPSRNRSHAHATVPRDGAASPQLPGIGSCDSAAAGPAESTAVHAAAADGAMGSGQQRRGEVVSRALWAALVAHFTPSVAEVNTFLAAAGQLDALEWTSRWLGEEYEALDVELDFGGNPTVGSNL